MVLAYRYAQLRVDNVFDVRSLPFTQASFSIFRDLGRFLRPCRIRMGAAQDPRLDADKQGMPQSKPTTEQLQRIAAVLTDIQEMTREVEATGQMIRERIERSNEILAIVRKDLAEVTERGRAAAHAE